LTTAEGVEGIHGVLDVGVSLGKKTRNRRRRGVAIIIKALSIDIERERGLKRGGTSERENEGRGTCVKQGAASEIVIATSLEALKCIINAAIVIS